MATIAGKCSAKQHIYYQNEKKNNEGLLDNGDDNNRSDTMRHFHEMSQPVIVKTTERMFGGCEDTGACCPGSHKAKQLEEDAFFFNKDILSTQSCHMMEVTTTTDS